MKRISLREFQLKPSKYLSQLPIVLTKYNLPVAIVYAYDKEPPPLSQEEVIPQGQAQDEVVTPENFSEVKDANLGFCQLTLGHPYQKGVERQVKQITVYDANDEIAHLQRTKLDGIWACTQCIEKLKSLIEKEGGRIDGMV